MVNTLSQTSVSVELQLSDLLNLPKVCVLKHGLYTSFFSFFFFGEVQGAAAKSSYLKASLMYPQECLGNFPIFRSFCYLDVCVK